MADFNYQLLYAYTLQKISFYLVFPAVSNFSKCFEGQGRTVDV